MGENYFRIFVQINRNYEGEKWEREFFQKEQSINGLCAVKIEEKANNLKKNNFFCYAPQISLKLPLLYFIQFPITFVHIFFP